MKLSFTPKLITAAIAVVGILLYFLGLCIAQSQVNGGFGYEWYLFFFLLVWAFLACFSLLCGALEDHRLLLVAWTSIGIAYLPGTIAGTLSSSRFNNTFGVGAGIMCAGLIITVLAFFCFLVMVATKGSSMFTSIQLTIRRSPKTTAPEP